MPASLIVSVEKNADLAKMVTATEKTLMRLLKAASEPSLMWKRSQASPFGKDERLIAQNLDVHLPTTCFKYEGDSAEDSLVSLFVFRGFKRGPLLSSCAEARTPASNVLAASIAIAAAEVLDSSIEDSSHHWIDRDTCLPNDLLEKLTIESPAPDFEAGLRLV